MRQSVINLLLLLLLV